MRVWIEAAVGLIFPAARPPRPWPRLERPFCERCAEPYPRPVAESFVCANCGKRDWSLSRLRAAYREQGSVREAILGFKYRRQFHLRPWLGRWLEDGFREHYCGERWEALVPVPRPMLRARRGRTSTGSSERGLLAVWRVALQRMIDAAELRRSVQENAEPASDLRPEISAARRLDS